MSISDYNSNENHSANTSIISKTVGITITIIISTNSIGTIIIILLAQLSEPLTLYSIGQSIEDPTLLRRECTKHIKHY